MPVRKKGFTALGIAKFVVLVILAVVALYFVMKVRRSAPEGTAELVQQKRFITQIETAQESLDLYFQSPIMAPNEVREKIIAELDQGVTVNLLVHESATEDLRQLITALQVEGANFRVHRGEKLTENILIRDRKTTLGGTFQLGKPPVFALAPHEQSRQRDQERFNLFIEAWNDSERRAGNGDASGREPPSI